MSLVAGGSPLASKWGDLLKTLVGKGDTAAIGKMVESYDLSKSDDPLELHLMSRIYSQAGDTSKATEYSTKAAARGYAGSK